MRIAIPLIFCVLAIVFFSGCGHKDSAAGLSRTQQQAQEQASIAAIRASAPKVTPGKIDSEIQQVQANTGLPADLKAKMVQQLEYDKRFTGDGPKAGPGPNLPPPAQLAKP
jgi:hypothetical protein